MGGKKGFKRTDHFGNKTLARTRTRYWYSVVYAKGSLRRRVSKFTKPKRVVQNNSQIHTATKISRRLQAPRTQTTVMLVAA